MMVGFGDGVGLPREPLRVGHHALVGELHLDAVLVVEEELRVDALAALYHGPQALTRSRCAEAVSVVAVVNRGGNAPEAWATIAASLAVVAALTSAWTSQRLLEIQEAALQPDLEPRIDAHSRYQLVQFQLVNLGKSPALDVSVAWDGSR